MMFLFLLIVQTLVAATMIAIILMQRSEGGGLVSGGSPSGMMSARGAADFLTRSTAILAAIFVVLSIAIAAIAAAERGPNRIDPSLVQQPSQPGSGIPPAGSPIEQQQTPFDIIPGAGPAPAGEAQPAPAPANQSGGVPIAQ